jgi:hypothetical protein
MKPDLKPFVEAVREKDIKRAKEKLEEINRGLDPNDGFWKGYRLALHGIVAAIEAGDELTVIKRIINGGYTHQHIRELLDRAKARLSDAFRPEDERGFDTAWADVLQIFMGET